MKKTYQLPQTIIIQVEVQPLMELSTHGYKMDFDSPETDVDAGAAVSRESGDWDD